MRVRAGRELAVLALGVAALFSRAAEAPRTEPAMVAKELRGGVYVLSGRGGNIAMLASEQGTLLVDDQYKERTELIRKAVAELTPQPIRWVINTHWHFDHTGGNENLGAAGVTLIAHENARRYLITGARLTVMKIDQPPTTPAGLPSVTFAQGVTLHRGDETIEVVHPGTPAHTEGDAFVFFRKANVAHLGDVFVRYGLPFIDTEHGGSLAGVVRACELVLARIDDETWVIPGHGAVARKADLAAYTDKLRTAHARLADLLKAGKTTEQILAADPLNGIDLAEGGAINRKVFVLLALDGMVREKK